MEFDVIALGETMLALAPPSGSALRTTHTLLVDHAGAESNTCVGLARLGLRTAWVSRLGSDAAGDRILSAMRDEGVDVRWVERDPMRSTGLMIKDPEAGVRYYRRESAASAMGSSVLDSVPIEEARAVLVTGVTALIGADPHAAGLTLLTRARGLRIVDPNLRAGLWGSDRRATLVLPFIERGDLLLCGSAEIAEILRAGAAGAEGQAGAAEGTGPARGAGSPAKAAETESSEEEGALEELARAASALGPREIVIRGGATIGALADGVWHRAGIRRDASVDPIGAGDAFNAGYVAIRLRGGSVEDALRAGATCGAAVTKAISDTSAFPRGV
jgi:2-dehydro-3-deoxygluconokinase